MIGFQNCCLSKRTPLSLLFWTILLCPLCLYGQNSVLDSLETALFHASTNTAKIALFQEINQLAFKEKEYQFAQKNARQHIRIAQNIQQPTEELGAWKNLVRAFYYQPERDSALLYLNNFLALATTLESDKDLSWATNFYGLIYRNKGAYRLAVDYFEKSLAIRTRLKDTKGMANCYNNLGLVNNNLGNYEKALEHYQQSLALRKALKDEKGIAKSYLNIGGVYNEIGDYPKELSSYLEVLAYYEATQDKWGLGAIYNNLGNNQKDQGNFEQALVYYEKSLTYSQASEDKPMIANTLGNIGNLYGHLGEQEKNKEYLLQALALEQELGNKEGIARSNLNLGITMAALGDYPEALAYFEQSNQIYSNQNTTIRKANINIEIGKVYLKTAQWEAALIALKKGLAIAKEKGNWVYQKAAYENLAKTYEGLNNYPKAIEYFQWYMAAKDTLLNTEKTKQLAQMAAQYEFEKSQTTMQKLRAESIEAKLEMSEKLRNRNLLVGIALGIAFLLAGLYFIFRYRQRKQAFIAEQKRIRELLRIDQLKDQFLANTSHELRTPLNGIIGIASSLEAGVAGELPVKATENLQLITASGRRLSNLINDILDFSKLKNADLQLTIKPVDLYAATNIIIAMSRPLLETKPIQIINELAENMPLVAADEDRVQQILYNLIGNAIKFTEAGTVKVTGIVNGDFFELTVSDTGIGIPESQQQSIFKSFVQVDGSDTRAYSGTGLGLTITQQLIELHGGQISVKSKLGEGTDFTVSFPLSEVEKVRDSIITSEIIPTTTIPVNLSNNENSVARARTPSVSTFQNGEAIKILIVDDEPINRQVLENHLQLENYESVSAANGTEALALINEKHQKFDLIILDIMMPRLSGYEVCLQLRKQFSSIQLPVIMLTAKNGIDDLVEGFEVGANDFLTKPFSKEELISRIKAHLSLNRLNKASNKFVPYEFLKAIGRSSISDLQLGDYVQENVTVMFADIRDYTSLSEKMTPEQNFRFVNAFLRRLAPYIRQNKGFVNQFLGDGFMAIFPSTENYALKAAIEIQHKLLEYNLERVTRHRQPIRLGIGLHAGPLIMGIIGDGDRMDPATISDTVNTASRMEGLTKHYGVNIIVSEAFRNRLESRMDIHFRYLGKVKVKGKNKATGIYECFEGDTPESQSHKLMSMNAFEKGIHCYQKGDFEAASIFFLEVLKENNSDKTALHFFKKCTDLSEQELSLKWDGIDLL